MDLTPRSTCAPAGTGLFTTSTPKTGAGPDRTRDGLPGSTARRWVRGGGVVTDRPALNRPLETGAVIDALATVIFDTQPPLGTLRSSTRRCRRSQFPHGARYRASAVGTRAGPGGQTPTVYAVELTI